VSRGPKILTVSDEAATKPALETVLEHISDLRDGMDAFRAEMSTFRDEMNAFRASTEERLERIGIRMDRIESIALEARADVRELKREFNDFRSQFKQPA
jgi:hypothetical protein